MAFNISEQFVESLQDLPEDMKYRLRLWDALTRYDQEALRKEVLLYMISPSLTVKICTGIASIISSISFPFGSLETQKLFAGIFLGGHLGYFSGQILEHLLGKSYIVTDMDSELFTSLGAWAGISYIEKLDLIFDTIMTEYLNPNDLFIKRTKDADPVYQAYNTYVLFTSIIPTILRIYLTKTFNDLYPLKEADFQQMRTQVNISQIPIMPIAGYRIN